MTWLLRLFPFVLLAWGALDLAAAVGLWATAPWGRTAGLLALGTWLLEELFALGAGLTGWPAGADLSFDLVAPAVRLVVVGGLASSRWQYDPAGEPGPVGGAPGPGR